MHGLFSTEPDVFGGFTDVSPFVRNQDENADVTVFWRDWHSYNELEELTGPVFTRGEGCSVAIGDLREFLATGNNAWIWDDRREAWARVRDHEIRPGMLVMLRRDDGGILAQTGLDRVTGGTFSTMPRHPASRMKDSKTIATARAESGSR